MNDTSRGRGSTAFTGAWYALCLLCFVCAPLAYILLLAMPAAAVAAAVKLPREGLGLRKVGKGLGVLAVFTLPVCLAAAVHADVTSELTAIFSLSSFVTLAFIYLTVSQFRLAAADTQTPLLLTLFTIGSFGACLAAALCLISWYNLSSHGYFCYEMDQFFFPFVLGRAAAPLALAAQVTFGLMPALARKKVAFPAAAGCCGLVYGSFVLLWLFFPRAEMENYEARNSFDFDIMPGTEWFGTMVKLWLLFAFAMFAAGCAAWWLCSRGVKGGAALSLVFALVVGGAVWSADYFLIYDSFSLEETIAAGERDPSARFNDCRTGNDIFAEGFGAERPINCKPRAAAAAGQVWRRYFRVEEGLMHPHVSYDPEADCWLVLSRSPDAYFSEFSSFVGVVGGDFRLIISSEGEVLYSLIGR